MRSAFFGLNVAQQGLFTSRGNLDVINHNISNSEVKGYSRQYTVQKAARPMRSAHRGMVGTGSELITTRQYRSEYLDAKYRNFSKDLGEHKTKNEFLNQMEILFKEPYSKGLSTYLDKLYAGIETLTTTPHEDAAKTNVIQLLKGVTDAVNDSAKNLRMLQEDLNFEIKSAVNRINGYAEQIAALNRQIEDSELGGHQANDLRDQRNRLLDELSQIVPISYREEVDGLGQKSFRVTINGAQLVNSGLAHYLEVRPREHQNNPEDNAGLYDVYWKTGQKLNVTSGSFGGVLRGLFEVRDGANSHNFRGQVQSVDGAATIKIKNASRFDLPKAGQINVQGVMVEYTAYTYNEATKEVTLTLKNPAPAGLNGKMAIMGENTGFRGIPYYMARLNEFSRVYASKMNEMHQRGRDNQGVPLFVGKGNLSGSIASVQGNPATSITLNVEEDEGVLANGKLTLHGKEIEYSAVSAPTKVVMPDGSVKLQRTFTLKTPMDVTDSRLQVGVTARVQDISADNFTVNPEVMNDIKKLESYYSKEKEGNVSDTTLLHEMISLRQNTHFFDRGTPDNFIQGYMGELGIDKAQASSFQKSGKDLIKMVDIQRMSVSGVNRDEEIAEMTANLQVYRYSAKAMDVFDKIYETTINLGR